MSNYNNNRNINNNMSVNNGRNVNSNNSGINNSNQNANYNSRSGAGGSDNMRYSSPSYNAKPPAKKSSLLRITMIITSVATCLLLVIVSLLASGVLSNKSGNDSVDRPPSITNPGGDGDNGSGDNGGGNGGGGDNGGGGQKPPSPPSGGGDSNLTGDTSPDGVEIRIKASLPRDIYEKLYPVRFGSSGWKATDSAKNGPYASEYSTLDEYYSYDNLIKAARWLATKEIVVETRTDENGKPIGYTAQTKVIDKETGSETLVAPGNDFDAEWNLSKPIGRQTVDLGSFMQADSANDSARDLIGFLANMAHETTGQNVDGAMQNQFEGGLFWIEETSYAWGWTDPGYVDTTNTVFPAVPGQSYHGRGPVQLSWNYNYGLVSGILYGDKNVLLQNPDLVTADGVVGFATGLLFWLTPQPPKASCSDIMTKKYVLTAEDIAANRQLGFGLTIIVFNGGLEGNKDESDGQIYDRVGHYRRLAAAYGIDIQGEKLDTLGMYAWV